jgi:hypothetical protein
MNGMNTIEPYYKNKNVLGTPFNSWDGTKE